MQKEGEVEGSRRETEDEKSRRGYNEKAGRYINKMVGTTYFHYGPLLFPLLLDKRTRSKSFPEKA